MTIQADRKVGPKGLAAKEALARATLRLIQAQGYHGTGVAEVAASSGVSKGSLFFHYPDGKDQLAVAAIDLAEADISHLLRSAAASATTLVDAIATVLETLAADLIASDFTTGCPVAVVTIESGGSNERLRDACVRAYDSWVEPVREMLASHGFPAETAAPLASTIVSLVEGAMVTSRARRDTAPLRDAQLMLGMLLAANGEAS
ncbi:TetR/AcrR family transcriptional regulator [Salinibacterium sp. ZJ454]|uniref:TetR/AcrR family transcriptional regulator n=1 Tax=Salinibacterium sp. ZJ454 TaxID=2708339 RepID=UPI0014206E90|nr:TetR/AcrR family transcriptional regulator [Salinibacterium sp. ZJ454]